jgi:sugar lactone lactonase YvrE
LCDILIKKGDVIGNFLISQFYFPKGIVFDKNTNSLLVADSWIKKIKQISLNNKTITILSYTQDKPWGIRIDKHSNIYYSDDYSIWRIKYYYPKLFYSSAPKIF